MIITRSKREFQCQLIYGSSTFGHFLSQEAYQCDPWKGKKAKGQGAGDEALGIELGCECNFGEDIDFPLWGLENKDVKRKKSFSGTFHFAKHGQSQKNIASIEIIDEIIETHFDEFELNKDDVPGLRAILAAERRELLKDNRLLANEFSQTNFSELPTWIQRMMHAHFTPSKCIHPNCHWLTVQACNGAVLVIHHSEFDRALEWSYGITQGNPKFRLTERYQEILASLAEQAPRYLSVDVVGQPVDKAVVITTPEPLAHHGAADDSRLVSSNGPTSQQTTLEQPR